MWKKVGNNKQISIVMQSSEYETEPWTQSIGNLHRNVKIFTLEG